MQKCFLLVLALFFSLTLDARHIYADELEAAFVAPHAQLSRSTTLNDVNLLNLVRYAQWQNFVSLTQQRAPQGTDGVLYASLNNEISAFGGHCYGLDLADAPLFYARLKEYADVLGIALPFVVIVDNEKILEVSALNWHKKTSFLILSRGLFLSTNEEEFWGFVLHQLCVVATSYLSGMVARFAPTVAGAVCLCMVGGYGVRKISIFWCQVVAALGLTALVGVGLISAWHAFARDCQKKADGLLASLQPEYGLAMIEALERGMRDLLFDDLIVARECIDDLPMIAPAALEEIRERYNTLCAVYTKRVMAHKERTGIWGSMRALSLRKRFFKEAVKRWQHR